MDAIPLCYSHQLMDYPFTRAGGMKNLRFTPGGPGKRLLIIPSARVRLGFIVPESIPPTPPLCNSDKMRA
jgi:hypothetical protein